MLFVCVSLFASLNIGWGVDKLNISNIVRLETIASWLDLENILGQNSFLVGFLLAWFAWVSPNLFFNRIIRGEFEVVVKISSSEVLNCYYNLSGFEICFRRNIAEVPFELF